MRRAFKHLQDLDLQLKAWLDGDHHRVRQEYDSNARWMGSVPPGLDGFQGYYLAGSVPIGGTAVDNVVFGLGTVTCYASAEQPPLDPIGLLIGDALHNLRSALDTL